MGMSEDLAAEREGALRIVDHESLDESLPVESRFVRFLDEARRPTRQDVVKSKGALAVVLIHGPAGDVSADQDLVFMTLVDQFQDAIDQHAFRMVLDPANPVATQQAAVLRPLALHPPTRPPPDPP